MAQSLAELRDWIVHQATCTARRALIVRYVVPLAIVAAITWIVPKTPLEGPVGGVLALFTILVCCWYAGPGPSLLIPGLIVLMSRLGGEGASRPNEWSSREITAFAAMTVLTAAVGLAGQYRRSFVAATRLHEARATQQAKVLSLARILFRELDGRITSWTQGAEELFGWTSAEATGRLIQDLLQTQFPGPVEEIHRELLRNHQWHGEVIQKCKDRRELIIATHWILYQSDEGKDDGVAEVHNDVTELRRIEASLRESERRKDLFVATLAHELRNPLAPIRNGVQCLRLMQGAAADERMFAIVERQLDHMVRLVDDLLDVSRINTGKIDLRREQVALRQIVDDAIGACRSQIESARHELTVKLPDVPVHLHADPARLTQVLTNLLHNAAKFTKPEGRITVSAECSAQQVGIRIRDSGEGIPAEALPRVFDTFAQVQDLRTRSHGGLGLGLSIVKSLVALHDGTVEARSEGIGHGSEFIVRLPIALNGHPHDQLPRNDHSPGKTGNPASPKTPRDQSRRVLVVDDNHDAARTMALALSMFGCTCKSAFDGKSALQMAEEFEPHAFVLDLGMPGISGFDLARKLRAQSRFEAALLIAVTGWDKEEDRRDSKEAGFDYHFAKPVDVGKLKDLFVVPSSPSSGERDRVRRL